MVSPKIVQPVPRNQLEQIATKLYDSSEVIAAYAHEEPTENFRSDLDNIVNLLKRRPCSLEDIANGLGIHRNEAAKRVERLASEGTIKAREQHGAL